MVSSVVILATLSYSFRKFNGLNVYPLLKDFFFVYTIAEQLNSLNKFILSSLFALFYSIIMRLNYIQI